MIAEALSTDFTPPVATALDEPALDRLFRKARSHNGWKTDPLPESLLREVYNLAKWGPTAVNSTPARFVFVTSNEGRAKLSALASGNNQAKILQAPVTVIIGSDLDFPETLPRLFPHAPGVKDNFADPEMRAAVAFRNSSLQGAYLMIAARALGLDTGPMSGFDNAAVDAAFFPGTQVKSNFICSIGYGTDENLFPRGPRLDFDEAARFA